MAIMFPCSSVSSAPGGGGGGGGALQDDRATDGFVSPSPRFLPIPLPSAFRRSRPSSLAAAFPLGSGGGGRVESVSSESGRRERLLEEVGLAYALRLHSR